MGKCAEVVLGSQRGRRKKIRRAFRGMRTRGGERRGACPINFALEGANPLCFRLERLQVLIRHPGETGEPSVAPAATTAGGLSNSIVSAAPRT